MLNTCRCLGDQLWGIGSRRRELAVEEEMGGTVGVLSRDQSR